jgi:hypothetical protein
MNDQYDPIALEILKMARELVLNEYTDKRAQDHNKWLADFEVVWKNNRIRLPYPDIPPYPTEKEIVRRAQVLMDFLHTNKNNNNTNVIDSNKTVNNVPSVEQLVEIATENTFETPIKPIVEPMVDQQSFIEVNQIQEQEIAKDKTSESILPSFLRKLKS